MSYRDHRILQSNKHYTSRNLLEVIMLNHIITGPSNQAGGDTHAYKRAPTVTSSIQRASDSRLPVYPKWRSSVRIN